MLEELTSVKAAAGTGPVKVLGAPTEPAASARVSGVATTQHSPMILLFRRKKLGMSRSSTSWATAPSGPVSARNRWEISHCLTPAGGDPDRRCTRRDHPAAHRRRGDPR
jgi:hypothetical protein